jgi:hypothetical protein
LFVSVLSDDTDVDKDLFSYLVENPAVQDAAFSHAFDAANDVLCAQGTTTRMLQAAPFVGVNDLVGSLFFVKDAHGLQLWQLVTYDVSHRRFQATAVSGPKLSFNVPVHLFGRMPFVCRPSLPILIEKAGGVSHFPVPDCILGVSMRDLDGGGREFSIGKAHDTFVSFVQSPPEMALQTQVPHAQDPYKSAAVRAIPAATASVLFTGMLTHPGNFTHNRSHSVFYDVLSSGGLSGIGVGSRFIVADTIVRIAPPKQVAISFLQLMWVNLAYFQTVASSEVYKAMDQNAKDFGPPMECEGCASADPRFCA